MATKRKSTRKRISAATAAKLNPTSLTAAQATRLLRLPAKTIERHIEEGAPTTAQGRINLVHYAAWLVAEIANPNQAP